VVTTTLLCARHCGLATVAQRVLGEQGVGKGWSRVIPAEAEQIYVRALAGCEKGLGLNHTSTLDTVNNLGDLYSNQGKLTETEQMFVRVLAGYEKALGPNYISTLDTVNNLGALYRDQGKLAEAKQIYQRALLGLQNSLESEHSQP
jgi:tetratricopeptide (TPR) repeat protein